MCLHVLFYGEFCLQTFTFTSGLTPFDHSSNAPHTHTWIHVSSNVMMAYCLHVAHKKLKYEQFKCHPQDNWIWFLCRYELKTIALKSVYIFTENKSGLARRWKLISWPRAHWRPQPSMTRSDFSASGAGCQHAEVQVHCHTREGGSEQTVRSGRPFLVSVSISECPINFPANRWSQLEHFRYTWFQL